MQDLHWEDIFSSPSVTHSQNLQDLIRVAGDKVLTGPTETFIHSKVHTAVSSPFLTLLASSLFSTIILFQPAALSFSSVTLPLPLTLTFQATLSINICLWVLPPPHYCFWREQGNLPSPVDVNTHSRLGVPQLQELTDQGFTQDQDICRVHSIKSPHCQTQTHLSDKRTSSLIEFHGL